jgi:crotonobetainyl-CoA:carnitine CoA-transferase CaiB-like acyl-CoA transferase
MSPTSPLSGVRILDLSRVLAGPWASQLLADLGADVIKVERPGTGDDTRAWGPPWVGGSSSYFACTNRNKRSIAVDFARPEGQRLVAGLAGWADVLLENYKVGGLSAYGLDYAQLSAQHPRLVYCSITGFGADGPYAERPGYDMLAQAMGGLMSLTGRPEGEPGAGPLKVGVAMADLLTGLYASNAILAALLERGRSGRGQHIELALLDVQVACLANQALGYLTTGTPPARLGNAHPSIVPYEDFPTADGRVMIAVGNDRQFSALAALLGEPGWATDERCATNAARVAHRGWLVPEIGLRTARQPTSHWQERFDALGIPAGPVQDLGQVFADPHVRARGLQLSLEGGVPSVRNPIRLSRTPIQDFRAPPGLGQHTDEILTDTLGLSPAEIARLRADGTVA